MKKIFVFLAAIVLVFGIAPVTHAADGFAPNQFPGGDPTGQAVDQDGGLGSGDPTKDSFQIVTCKGVDDPRTDAHEKECDLDQLLLMARRIIQLALFALTPIVIVMIAYTGFKYMTAQGDVNMLADAKRMLTPIVIGIILIFAAWVLVYTVLDKLLADQIGEVKKSDIVPSGINQ
ncbi:MAG TPA: pilin [Candidatus Paceibacterota bacterium]|jgi:hypothetical protein